MKKHLPLSVVAVFLLTSCGSLSSFESPNNLHNVISTLYLQDGKSFEGKLVVRTGNFFGPEVKLYQEAEKTPIQFPLREVRGYRIGDDFYSLKNRKEGFGIGRLPLFMKRLTTEGSRIHLYESMERKPSPGKGSQSLTGRYQLHYYIEFAPDETVHSINGPRLVPHFEQKMSDLLADCPALARKISAQRFVAHY